MYREYDADLRDLEERYMSDSEDEILEQISTNGKIDLERLKQYTQRQYTEIRDAQRSSDTFFQDVKTAKAMGATHREIWGEQDHVSFPETIGIKIRRARQNLKTCKKLLGLEDRCMQDTNKTIEDAKSNGICLLCDEETMEKCEAPTGRF